MESFDELVRVMQRLRAPGGCPWDREQSHTSIRRYVIEEAYEVAEAIDDGDMRELRAELGDLLLQVEFHSEMAREAGHFDVDQVCTGIVEKMTRRHPHVFGDVSVEDAEAVKKNWEAIKAAERGPDASVLDGVPRALPALQRAERLGEKASRVGFDWSDAEGALAKVDEERAELTAALAGGDPAEIDHELGDLLFSVANLARKLGRDPELALQNALGRFEERFRAMEKALDGPAGEATNLSAPEWDQRWEAAKRAKNRQNRR